jgi:bis(5'-nucleosyl)-tetraphosphatase (symmetrical)
MLASCVVVFLEVVVQEHSPGIVASISGLTGAESSSEIANLVRRIIASGDAIDKSPARLVENFIAALKNAKHELFLNAMYIAIVNKYGYAKNFCQRSLYCWSKILRRGAIVSLGALNIPNSYKPEKNWQQLASGLFAEIFMPYAVDKITRDAFAGYFADNVATTNTLFFAGIFQLVAKHIGLDKTFCGVSLIDWSAALLSDPEVGLFLQVDDLVSIGFAEKSAASAVAVRTKTLPLYNALANHKVDLQQTVEFWIGCVMLAKKSEVSLLYVLINSGIIKYNGVINKERKKLLASLTGYADLNKKIAELRSKLGVASNQSKLLELERILQYFNFFRFIYFNSLVGIGVANAFIDKSFNPRIFAQKMRNPLVVAFLGEQSTASLGQSSQALIGSGIMQGSEPVAGKKKMTTYFIGDVQGCYKSLMRLLEQINYNSARDTLCFCGDLVNRGPASLDVLDFVLTTANIKFVLGNHDIYALYYLLGGPSIGKDHTLDALIASPRKNKFIDLLLNAELMLYEPGQYAVVHAGIVPQWSVADAFAHATLWRAMLLSHDPLQVIKDIWGNAPCDSEYAADPIKQLRYVVNVLTRIRFCDAKGALDFHCKMRHCNLPGYQPWFAWRQANPSEPIIFGHWAALEGVNLPGIIGLDTGCAWGKSLTAYDLKNNKYYVQEYVG